MLSSPEILSHAIHETLKFDRTLREQELYQPPGQNTEWQGTVQIFLGNREWLKTWLRVEKDCKRFSCRNVLVCIGYVVLIDFGYSRGR